MMDTVIALRRGIADDAEPGRKWGC